LAVLVTDGNQRSTLALVRALGPAGIPVTVGESSSRSLAGSSRHCKKTLCYPSPIEESQNFLDFLQAELRTNRYDLLVPMTDVTLQVISAARESFLPFVQLPLPDHAQVELVQDKRQVIVRALQLRIPCPESYMLHEDESVESVARRVRFPAVIKPRFSRYYREGRWASGPVQYADSPETLADTYRRVHAQIPNPLVQEKVEGEGRGVFLLIWDGELKAAFCHRRLREKPPWGGVSVYCESLPLDEAQVEKSFALLKALGWRGVAMVEFKMDRRDGQPKFMEINGRFWGSLQLAVDAGVNFPLLLYRLARGENITAQFDYKAGVKNRWLLGDLDHLWIRFRHSRASNGARLSGPSRLRSLLNFMKFYERDLHYDVLRLGDLAPGWYEFKNYLREGFRQARPRREVAGAR
jgi:predicted ATP-grasp superfamily ATP-dependent carboligase